MTTHLMPEQAQAFCDGEVNASGLEVIREHLRTCADCSRLVERSRRTVALLQTMPRRDPPPEFLSQVLTRLGIAGAVAPWGGRASQLLSLVSSSAGALLLLLSGAELVASEPDLSTLAGALSILVGWPEAFLASPASALGALSSGASSAWQGLGQVALTAVPLGLALIGLGGLLQMLRWVAQPAGAAHQRNTLAI